MNGFICDFSLAFYGEILTCESNLWVCLLCYVFGHHLRLLRGLSNLLHDASWRPLWKLLAFEP